MSITHEIYNSFDEGFEVCGVFLDIPKPFDKVWNEGLLFKLQMNEILGKLLLVFQNFLTIQKERLNVNCTQSPMKAIKAGVAQGSILGPFLFLIYTNELSEGINSNQKLIILSW